MTLGLRGGMQRAVLVIAIVATPAPAAAQEVAPDNFAIGAEINTTGPGPLHGLVLPPAVYETATRADLGDVTVFNAANQEVSVAIDRVRKPTPGTVPQVALPFFPLYGDPELGLNEVVVDVRRSDDGQLIRIQDRRTHARKATLRAIIVDASALDEALSGMTLHWADTSKTFMVTFRAETSDDLTTWYPWGSSVTLANLSFGGNVLRQNELTLVARKSEYIRLSWDVPEGPPGMPPPIDSVVAFSTQRPAEPERAWQVIEEAEAPMTANADGSVFWFRQTGVAPVDRVRIALPDTNTVARVTIEAAPDPEGPWTILFAGLVFRLEHGGTEIRNPDIRVRPGVRAWWRVKSPSSGDGLRRNPPTLRLGWVPDRLLFVERGSGPFTLAFGSATTVGGRFEAQELRGLVSAAAEGEYQEPMATVGAIRILGGSDRLHATREIPWQQVVLWAALLAGVLLLATMLIRLLKQIDKPSG